MDTLTGPVGRQGCQGAQDGRGTVYAIKNAKQLLLDELNTRTSQDIHGIIIEFKSRYNHRDSKLFVLFPEADNNSLREFLNILDFNYNHVSDSFIEGRIWYKNGDISVMTSQWSSGWSDSKYFDRIFKPKLFYDYYESIESGVCKSKHIFY